jgi:hypothetical protein
VFSEKSDDFTTRVEPEVLTQTFLQHIRDAASNAREGERIFILVLTHGDEDGMVEIGEQLVSREEVEGCFARAPRGVKVTILLTSCLTSLWAVPFTNPSPIKSTVILSATNSLHPSFTFPASDSQWNRGSMFAEAVSDMFASTVGPGPGATSQSISDPVAAAGTTKLLFDTDLKNNSVISQENEL